MTGQDSETLTAALRRLADEHASGLLSVATTGRDVVLELADGVPVGIGPPHDVGDRVGRDASAELVAAAVIDDLVDRTVAAIVGGGGAWVWDVADDAAMMPVPPDLATELSRRAVDAAQALATLGPDQVLRPGRDLETHGEVDRVRELFDGTHTLMEVAELAELTLPATATLAAALVSAGVLTTGQEDASPLSWTDAVASSSSIEDEDEDEPELWVMDPPEDEADEDDEEDHREDDAPAATAAPAAATTRPDAADDSHEDAPVATSVRADDGAARTPAPAEPAVPAEPTAAAAGDPPGAHTPADEEGADDWADTTWLDELGASDQYATTARGDEGEDDPGDARAALSAMITDLQGPAESAPPPTPTERTPRRQQADPADTPDDVGDGETPEERAAAEARRKEPKAAPGEVAEFLRELSRLALDDE